MFGTLGLLFFPFLMLGVAVKDNLLLPAGIKLLKNAMVLALTLLIQTCCIATTIQGAAVLGVLWEVSFKCVVGPCLPYVALLMTESDVPQLR